MPVFERWIGGFEQRSAEARRPVVSLCYAQSLDGCLAAERGRPTALSGPEARRLTHELRAWHDAILIGIGTSAADNPRLTVRDVAGRTPQPVILDTRLRTRIDSYLVSGHPLPAWIAGTAAADPGRRTALEDAGAVVLTLPTDAAGQVDLIALLGCLYERGVRRLMVEGGAAVLSGFIAAGLADLACITIAPVFLGGLPSVVRILPQPPRLTDVIYESHGEDLVVWGTFRSIPVILEP